MRTVESVTAKRLSGRLKSYRERSLAGLIASSTLSAIAAFGMFYCSLIATSAPVTVSEMDTISRAIAVLEAKGFDREVFLLRNVVLFRGTENWFNAAAEKENAFAATNFPFEVITVYPDFYNRAVDDTERAMILLHEAQHLKGSGESESYAYVWQNRNRLGWTQLSHGTTETYITVDLLTREHAPNLFTCEANYWSDCTENLKASMR